MILCLPFPLLILLSQFLSFSKAQKEGAAAHQSVDISPSSYSLFAALIRYSSFIMPPTPRGSLGTGAVWSGYGKCSSESNEFESSELSIPSYETLKYSSYLYTNSHIFGSIHKCKVCIKPRIESSMAPLHPKISHGSN